MKGFKHMQSKGRKQISRLTAVACVTVLATGLVLSGCGKQDEEEEKDNSILVETTKPVVANIELDGDFIGTVETDNEIKIIPKVAGDVTATYFEVGDHVEVGDLLFTIDDRSAQIAMAQAQASMETANASVSNAQTNVTLQELNLLYTQEQIKQSLGTTDTTQMQLENAVASAKYALKAAQENEQLAAEQFGLARDRYDDLEDSLDDYRDSANSYGDYANYLEKVRTKYVDIVNAGSASDAEILFNTLTGGKITLPADVVGSAQSIGNYYIYCMTGKSANSEYELGVLKSSAQSAQQSMKAAREAADGNKDSLKLNMFSAAISKETSKNAVLSAEDAKRLAEKMLDDYNNYTKAVIIAGANYQLAGADAGRITAGNSLTQAQAGVKQAQAGIDLAQLQLDNTQVTSPVAGTIIEKNVITNNMATQGATAYVICADDANSISFYVAEAVMEQLSLGEEIHVERSGKNYTAKISENTGIADASNGLFKVKAQLVSGSDKLVSGTSVKLTMATQKAENVMTIPIDSVYYESLKAYVFLAQDGKAVKTEIEVGIANDECVEVISGLSNDSQVIVTWAAQLKNGSEIRVKNQTQESKNGVPKGVTEEEAAAEKEAASIDTIADMELPMAGVEAAMAE